MMGSGGRGGNKTYSSFLHVSREEGTFIPLSTEVRNPTVGRTHPAFNFVTLFAPFHKRRSD